MNKRGILIPYRWILMAVVLATAVFWSVSIITAQPPVPHAVPPGLEVDCLSCHQAGVAGAPRLAWDHLGRANADCQQCHAISGNMAVGIPHTLNGRDNCYDCHLDGSGGAPKVAGNHASYGVETCQMCHPHQEIVVEEEIVEEVDEGPHILWGLDAGKTCLECHRQQFVDENHVEITEIAQTKELKESQGEFLFSAYCATCHGEDGTTEVFPVDLVNSLKEERLDELQAEAEKAAKEAEELGEEADDEESVAAEPTEDEAEESAEVEELTLDDIEVEPEPGTGIIINSPEYLSLHDDATIMRAIMNYPGDEEHVFARAYGGALKFGDVVNLGSHIRAWGEIGPELGLPVPSFAEDVYPIMEKECGGQCHLDKQKGDWSIAGYEDIMATGGNAPVIIPGDPDNSLLAQKLRNTQTIGDMMPPDLRLKDTDVSLIVEWIRAGAPNN
jgi:hypothetical protein